MQASWGLGSPCAWPLPGLHPASAQAVGSARPRILPWGPTFVERSRKGKEEAKVRVAANLACPCLPEATPALVILQNGPYYPGSGIQTHSCHLLG